jgi:hypothetical protein
MQANGQRTPQSRPHEASQTQDRESPGAQAFQPRAGQIAPQNACQRTSQNPTYPYLSRDLPGGMSMDAAARLRK